MQLVSKLRENGQCVSAGCSIPAGLVYEHAGLRIRACGQYHAEIVADKVDAFKQWLVDNKCTGEDIEGGALLFCEDHPEWRPVVHKVILEFLK